MFATMSKPAVFVETTDWFLQHKEKFKTFGRSDVTYNIESNSFCLAKTQLMSLVVPDCSFHCRNLHVTLI